MTIPPCRRTPDASTRGAALVAAVFIVMLVFGVVAASLAPLAVSTRDARERAERVRARYLCMSAASRAHYQIIKDAPKKPGDITSGVVLADCFDVASPRPDDFDPDRALAATRRAPDGSYMVHLTYFADASWLIEAFARCGDSTVGVARVLRSSMKGGYYRWAAFARSGFTNSVRIYSDAYSSAGRDPTYVAQANRVNSDGLAYAQTIGNIASNGAITLREGFIHGNVTPGPTRSATLGTTQVSGLTTPAMESVDLPNVSYKLPATNDNSSLGANLQADGTYLAPGGITNLPAGNYVLNAFTANSKVNSELHIPGNVNLYVTGDVTIAEGAKIIIDAGAKLEIYTTGNVTIGGRGIENRTGKRYDESGVPKVEGRPEKLQIYVGMREGATSPPQVTIQSGIAFYGVLYAPQSRIDVIGASGGLFGSVIGDTIANPSPTFYHRDLELQNMPAPPGAPPTTLETYARWWIG
jgi:hypothetical protein